MATQEQGQDIQLNIALEETVWQTEIGKDGKERKFRSFSPGMVITSAEVEGEKVTVSTAGLSINIGIGGREWTLDLHPIVNAVCDEYFGDKDNAAE